MMNRIRPYLLSAICTVFCMTDCGAVQLNQSAFAFRFDRHATTATREAPYHDKVIYRGSGLKKEIALTFDDGPDNRYTPQILDILDKNHVQATFFIIGKRAKEYPNMVQRMHKEGHAIGNHTWDHPDMVKLSPDQIRDELLHTDEELKSIVGYYPTLFRPPYGAASSRVIKEITSLGYKVVDWSVDTKDWAGTPTPTILQYVQKDLNPGGIILEHCAGGDREDLSNTVRALPQIITSLKAQGYTFVTVPQLLNIPVAMDEDESDRDAW